ncbi:MAG: aspartate/glutamate racemase family protein [Mesorhizobium sp.]|nr:MAG: aspartate/glutamate racemase family protein [Mesorhizobium sp.]
MINDIRQLTSKPLGLFGGQKPLGVVGGMGSFATAKFLEVLARKSRAERDQDHIPFICLSAPNIADRSKAIAIGSDAPLRQILERTYWLEKTGCGAIAIPCNTAHLWANEIKGALSVKLIDMVEITRKAIESSCGSEARNLRSISLGTSASIRNGLYAWPYDGDFGNEYRRNSHHIQHTATKIIDAVKSGNMAYAHNALAALIQSIRSIGFDTIVLGCSELSAICGDLSNDADIIDPIDILADACIDWWATEGRSPPDISAARSQGEKR